jgi:pimeloyl-ACP methyl ester carboxylesterase
MRTAPGRERGQTTAEYLGMVFVVLAIVAALAGSDLGRVIGSAVRAAICEIETGRPCASHPTTASVQAPRVPEDPTARAIREREQQARDAVVAKAERLQADPHHDNKELAALEKLEHSTLLSFDPANDHFAEVFGDLATATKVGVVVPGSGQNLENYFGGSGFQRKVQNLESAASFIDPRTASIFWEGYDTPTIDPRHLDLSAADYHHSVPAGHALDQFARGIQALRDYHVTVIGHSYGSLVEARAVVAGMRVDNFVAIGSPGLGFDGQPERDEFYSNSSRLWAARTPNDPYAGTSWTSHIGIGPYGVGNFFAFNPYDPANGFTQFRTNGPGAPHVSGHDSYLTFRSESLDNLADIVTGHYDEVTQWAE